MPISGQQAVDRGFVIDSCDTSIRQASYDLTVGEIIIPGVEGHNNVIEPQQMFVIISSEIINLPKCGHVAYVLPKTGLCREGILILNTGIIDPNYRGPVSTTAINFGSKSYPLPKGSAFSRVTFHKLDDGDIGTQKRYNFSKEEYRTDRIKDTDGFPEIFLNINGNVDEISQKVLKDSGAIITNNLVSQLTRTTLVLAIVAFVAPIIIGGLAKLLHDDFYLMNRRGEISGRLSALEGENAELKRQVAHLYTAIETLPNKKKNR